MLTACFVDNSASIGNQGSQIYDYNSSAAKALQVEILSNNPKYTLKRVKKGNRVFIDRPYSFSETSYENYCSLQTAMDDKRKLGNSFLTFTASRAITVYIGYDTRSPLPLWLSDWEDTGEEIIIDDEMGRYWLHLGLRLFKKEFSENATIELGGNENAGSMYIVLLDDDTGDCILKNDHNLELSWFPNRDKIDGYTIYIDNGTEMIPFTSVDIHDIKDPRNPSMEFRSWSDLGATGDEVCFSISAYLNETESSLSTPKCISI